MGQSLASTPPPAAASWHEQPGFVPILLAVVLAQVLTIAAMWLSRRRRLAAERSLRDQERQTSRLLAEKETILRGVPVAIVYVKERRILSHNRRCETMFGYAASELAGAPIETLFDSRGDYDALAERAVRALTERKTFSEEVALRRKDGSVFWGEVTGSSVDPLHPLDGSIWMCADVSERRRSEERLRKLQQAVEHSPVSIVIANREGDIEYVNPRFTEITGFSRELVLNRNLRSLQSAENTPEVYRQLWRTILAGETWRGVLRSERRNGELFWEEVSISPIFDDQGAVSHFVAVKEDITERKRIERQLEYQQANLEDLVQKRTAELTAALAAAKQADRAKDEFLANMSHELRTPLNVVIGLSDLARNLSQDPRQRDYLDKIADAGKQLSGIINDLLDLSKIVAGRMEIERTDFGLRDLVQRCHAAMALKAAEKRLQLVERIDDAVPDALLGDPVRLRQILFNLVGNAIKFTPEGRIEVRVGLGARRDRRVRLDIEVEDSGVGMSQAALEGIFKPFSQADASMTRKFGGTGLGLAICKRLAEMMDGDIAVASRAGSGTTFTVRVWLGLGGAPGPQGDDDRQPEYRNTRVLLVDDQPVNREIAEQLLRALGIVVRHAGSGREALDLLAAAGPAEFDLVLMDVQMPEMDGLTATREIRTRLGFTDIPIVAMTAHTMDHERQAGLAAGMNDHIGKPFDREDFYRILAKWLPRIKAHWAPAAAPAPAAEATGEWPTLEGVDTRAGLARFAGNQARYRHWLANFVAEGPDYVARMRAALTRGESDEARKTAHAVSGRTGMLGMAGLSAIATAIEAELQRGEPVDPLLDHLESALAQVRSGLAGVLAGAGGDDGGDRQRADATP